MSPACICPGDICRPTGRLPGSAEESGPQFFHRPDPVLRNGFHTFCQYRGLLNRKSRDLSPVYIRIPHDPQRSVRWNTACDAVIDRSTQGINIRPGTQAAPGLVLLDGREAMLQDRFRGLRQDLVHTRVLHFPHRAEIKQFCASVPKDHDIVRADIPVDDPQLMNLAQRVHHRPQDRKNLLNRNSPGPQPDKVLQVDTLHILHDDIRRIVRPKEIMDMNNGWDVPKLRQGPGLSEETLPGAFKKRPAFPAGARHRQRLRAVSAHETVGVVFLHRNRHIQIQVPAQIGDPKAALSQHPSDQVLFPKDRPHRKLMGQIIPGRIIAAVFTDELRRFLHTAQAPSFLHTLTSFSRLPWGSVLFAQKISAPLSESGYLDFHYSSE